MHFPPSRTRLFLALLLAAEILLVLSTWPLWTRTSAFPAIPLFPLPWQPTRAFDVALTVLLLLGCLTSLIRLLRHTDQSSLLAPFLAALYLVISNQHRLQPWHWLFLLISLQSIVLNEKAQLRVNQVTVASVYIFAALSRLGPNIDSGMSRQILYELLNLTGLRQVGQNADIVFAGCCVTAAMELIVGLALLLPNTRRFAVVVAIATHSILLVVLSPLGLNHNPAVLLWNVFFVLAVPVLFWPPQNRLPEENGSASTLQRSLMAFVIVFPLSGLFSIADNWPGWQLYSPRPEVVRLYVRQSLADRLPVLVQPHIGRATVLQDWRPVRLDQCSLAATFAPLYPEDRFQLGLILAVLPEEIHDGELRVTVEAPSSVFWWKREVEVLETASKIKARSQTFWLNAMAAN